MPSSLEGDDCFDVQVPAVPKCMPRPNWELQISINNWILLQLHPYLTSEFVQVFQSLLHDNGISSSLAAIDSILARSNCSSTAEPIFIPIVPLPHPSSFVCQPLQLNDAEGPLEPKSVAWLFFFGE